MTGFAYYVVIHDAAENPDAPLPLTFRCYDPAERNAAYLLRDHLRGLAGDGVTVEVEVLETSQPPDLDRLTAGVA